MDIKVKNLKNQSSMIDYLRSKNIDASYHRNICCVHPNHQESTPSCRIYKNEYGDYLHCFSCGFHADIYSLIGILEPLPNFWDQYKFLEKFNGKLQPIT